MFDVFRELTAYLALALEAIAGGVIAFAAAQATLRTILAATRRHAAPHGAEMIRLRLGTYLALALEFELAADLLRTAIAPTWTEIGMLGAIIVLRTALNYFLQQELDRAMPRQAYAAA